MENTEPPRNRPAFDPLRDDGQALLPAAAWLRYDSRADGWTAGRQAAFITHLADHGIVEAAAQAAGKSLSGAYALRRRTRGYAFSLGWEAALLLARQIVADKLMTAAVQGERAEWVREEGRTTYIRFNPRVATDLLERVDPMDAFPEVLAVVSHFDYFLHLIDTGASARELWDFFDCALARDDLEPRKRVRTCLLLFDESADFDGPAGEDADEIEVKSIEGRRRNGNGRAHMATLRSSPSTRAKRWGGASPLLRHCEEPFGWLASQPLRINCPSGSDEAIHGPHRRIDCFASLAKTEMAILCALSLVRS